MRVFNFLLPFVFSGLVSFSGYSQAQLNIRGEISTQPTPDTHAYVVLDGDFMTKAKKHPNYYPKKNKKYKGNKSYKKTQKKYYKALEKYEKAAYKLRIAKDKFQTKMSYGLPDYEMRKEQIKLIEKENKLTKRRYELLAIERQLNAFAIY